jgi:hypothetical protein
MAPSPRRGEGWDEGAQPIRMGGFPLTQLRLSSFVAKAPYPSPRWGEGFMGATA